MLLQQNNNSRDEDKGQEGIVELVVAGKNSAEPFELLEKAFHQMAFLIGMPVYRPWIVGAALRRDRIGGPLGNDVLADCFGVVCFVAEDIAALNFYLTEQRDCVLGIMVIPSAEQKVQGIPQSIHNGIFSLHVLLCLCNIYFLNKT